MLVVVNRQGGVLKKGPELSFKPHRVADHPISLLRDFDEAERLEQRAHLDPEALSNLEILLA